MRKRKKKKEKQKSKNLLSLLTTIRELDQKILCAPSNEELIKLLNQKVDLVIAYIQQKELSHLN